MFLFSFNLVLVLFLLREKKGCQQIFIIIVLVDKINIVRNEPEYIMFCRSQLILTPLDESRCVQDERCGVIWLKSMPCIGEQIPGKHNARIYYLWRIGVFCLHCCILFVLYVKC